MPAWFRLLRPGNALLAAAAAVVAGFIAADGELDSIAALVSALSVACCVAGGNALNDWYDRESDRENHPARPLPTGEISPTAALWLARGLLLAGVALAALLNPPALVIATAAVLLLVFYEQGLKASGLPGNLTIAALTGGLFLFGGIAVGDPGPVIWLAPLAALGALSRELVKDVEDLEGDRDRRTLPARIGPRPVLWLALGVMLAGAALSLPAALLYDGRGYVAYLALVVLADVIMLLGTVMGLRGDANLGQRLLKRGMALALLAFLAGAVIE